MIHEFFAALFLLIGAFFMFIAGVGAVRLPDIYLRMSATTKAATFGVGFVLLAVVTFFEDLGVSTRAVATILFLFLTTPVAAHVIGRASYLNKVPLWKGTFCDELKGMYDSRSHELASPDAGGGEAEFRTAEEEDV